MDDKIEAIRAAIAGGATSEQKAHGIVACRAILAALDAEPGKPIVLPGVPAPSPLANIDPSTALDLLIAKLTAALPSEGGKEQGSPPMPLDRRALRIAFVPPPPPSPRPPRAVRAPARRKP
jgi:hypothetical protein